MSKTIIYILRIIIFTCIVTFCHTQISESLMYGLGDPILLLLENSNLFFNNEVIELIFGLIFGLSCLFAATIGVTYVFAKICGLFKELDGLKRWQAILFFLLMSILYYKLADILYANRDFIDYDIEPIAILGLTLLPSYLFYLFLNFLSKKYKFFEKMGYYTSIEFFINLIDNRKYYFSREFLGNVLKKIKGFSFKRTKKADFEKTKERVFARNFLILTVVVQTALLLYAKFLENLTNTQNGWYNVIVFMGYLICFALYLKLKKQEKILSSTIFLFIFLIGYSYFEYEYFSKDSLGECAHGYCGFVEQLTTEEQKYKVNHFPKTLPPNVKNYSFLNDWSFGGDGIYYVKFNTDEEYIEEIINKNKENIEKEIPFEKIDNYYKLLDTHFKIKDREKFTVYIMKKPVNSDKYTSGIIASENEIIFFYANFNIERRDSF